MYEFSGSRFQITHFVNCYFVVVRWTTEFLKFCYEKKKNTFIPTYKTGLYSSAGVHRRLYASIDWLGFVAERSKRICLSGFWRFSSVILANPNCKVSTFTRNLGFLPQLKLLHCWIGNDLCFCFWVLLGFLFSTRNVAALWFLLLSVLFVYCMLMNLCGCESND